MNNIKISTNFKSKYMVFGLGKTGLSVAKYLRRNNIDAIYYDTRINPPNLNELKAIIPESKIFLGDCAQFLLTDVDRLVVSPGLNNNEPLIQNANNLGIEIISDIDIFVENTIQEFVVITGSNGKSTVTELLLLMCMKAKIEAVAGANLGKPALDLLSENIDIYLLELSSFHLARCNHLPAKVAALLNISSDHIDWHGSEESYYQAKYRIYREASSSVYNRNNLKSLDYIGEGLSSSFGMDQGNEDHFGTLKCDGIRYLAKGSEKLLSTHDIRLSGSHNIENILAAMSIGTLMGIPKESMIDAIKEFKGLPHRMQLIASINGVQYINDSKGTNVGAAIASVNSIEGSLILIAGGQGKGGDFKFFADSIYRNLKEIILIGEDSKIIAKEFEPLISTTIVDNLDEAVYLAAANSNKDGTVLLSPACASFDQFDSYIHRGDEFCRIVRELK